ncbi:MAG: nucleotidyl transferase AbiEii/AbiGii toxin family protein [Candidatus Berkiella sp.]
MQKIFLAQSKLVMQVLPLIHQEEVFLLKGGTAINFFHRDLPRLSVDIDLTYSDVEPREITLQKSNAALNRIINNLKNKLNLHVVIQKDSKQEFISKIEVQSKDAQIKIEPNFVFRGYLFPFQERRTTPKVEELLESATTMRILSFEELYAGKLCALLNRQHPRDIFDIKLLLENEGITEQLIDAFVVYLASDSRPITELLNPHIKALSVDFNSDFFGMTDERFTIDVLTQARDKICNGIIDYLSENQRAFLVSLVELEPNGNFLI